MLVLFKHRQELSGVLSSQWIVQVYITMLVSARWELSKQWWMWWGLLIDLLPISRSNKVLLIRFSASALILLFRLFCFFRQHTLWRNWPLAQIPGLVVAHVVILYMLQRALPFLLHCVFFSWASCDPHFVQESCLPQTTPFSLPFHLKSHLFVSKVKVVLTFPRIENSS